MPRLHRNPDVQHASQREALFQPTKFNERNRDPPDGTPLQACVLSGKRQTAAVGLELAGPPQAATKSAARSMSSCTRRSGTGPTDAVGGDERIEMLHRDFAWGLLGPIVLHVGDVIFTSLRQRENLVRSMLNGEKRAAQGDGVA